MTLEHFKLPRDDWYDITNWDYEEKEIYDPSKFTVVGNPTITDDGVLSNCSVGNIVQTPIVNINNPDWEFNFVIDTNGMSGANGILGIPSLGFCYVDVNNTTKVLHIYLVQEWSDGGGVSLFDLPLNKKYQVVWGMKGTTHYSKLKELGATEWLKESVKTYVTVKTASSPISIGRDTANNLYLTSGSIDLKQFSITVDGVEVFKGTKTVQEKLPPKGEIVGRLYKEALIENFNAIEAKLNELSGLTAYETQVPDFSNYNYEDVTLDSPNNKVVNLQSFLKIMNLIGVPIECRFTGKLCNKVTYYDKDMRYHTIVNQKLDDLGVDGKVYIILDSSNDTVSAVSDITDLTNKFLLGAYDNGRVYNLRSTGLVDINILTHLCDMSVEPFFIGSLNGTRATEGIYRNGRIVGAWGRESKGAYPKDITLFDIGRQ